MYRLSEKCLSSKDQPENPPTHNPDSQHNHNNNRSQLEHSNLISLLRHPRQAAHTALQIRAHSRECLIRIIERCLVARIIVDVQRYVLEL